MMRVTLRALALIATVAAASESIPQAQAATAARSGVPVTTCADLAKLTLPNATIRTAEWVAAGKYQVPAAVRGLFGLPGMNVAGRIGFGRNPAFCRVAATLRPSSDSDINIEVWLPRSGWNGKLLTAGNFGWAGSLMYGGMLTGLEAGYATASTDTGHNDASDGNGGRFALGHPEKLIDYAYRADHELTVDAKALIKAFYGKAPAFSYWIGCSLGGLEGLIEAKRYPEDYDGIVAGAPPNPLTRFNALQLWPDWLINQRPSRRIPKEKYALVHEAVLKACASPIGQKQGLVDEPDKCDFDPGRLQCKANEGPDCLTADQVDLLRQTYAGPVNPRTKEVIFPGPARGSELEMGNFASGEAQGVALDLFRYAAFGDSDWNWKAMDWDKDITAAIQKVGPLMHVDTDLKPFIDRGGKLLLYIGWNDYHNPEELIDYYKSVMKNAGGEQAAKSLRLFTIPGMSHCMGGAGCDTFDKLGAIDAWVAQGKAPQRIVAARVEAGKIVRTSPLCAYPEVAKYKGTGDTSDAASFVCTAGEGGHASAAQSASETELLQVEDALFAADIRHDVAAIQRGFADEALFVHANGVSQTKSDYLQGLEKLSFESIVGKDRVVRIFGDVGIVRGTKELVLGNGMQLSGTYLTVYIKRDGRWQMLDQQSAPAPKPPAGK